MAQFRYLSGGGGEVLEQKLRKFADFYVVTAEGEPVECWLVLAAQQWFPDGFFNKLIRVLKKCGLFFHNDHWSISEGLSRATEETLKHKLANLARKSEFDIWFAKITS